MDNPAERLLRILESAKNYPAKQHHAASAWKSIFGLQEELQIPAKLGGLYVLASRVSKEMVDRSPSSAKVAAHLNNCMLRMCHGRLNEPWEETSKYIDEHTIEYLRMHANFSKSFLKNREIDQNDFLKARSALEDAISEISRSNLSLDSKNLIIRRIRDILIAIDNFAITGQEAVFDAFKIAIIDLNNDLSDDNLPGKSSLREGLSTIADLLQVATAVPTLSPPVKQIIEFLLK